MEDVGTIAAETTSEIVKRLVGSNVGADEAKAAVKAVR